jgi:hypothetical protein
VAERFTVSYNLKLQNFIFYHVGGRLNRERLTNCTVDVVAGFRRLVAGGPSAGREFSDSISARLPLELEDALVWTGQDKEIHAG